MVLYAYPMDRTGCGFYRMIWPLRSLTSKLALHLVFPGDDAGISVNVGADKQVTDVEVPADCSAVLLQRPTSELLVSAIPFIQAAGCAVLVDVDDDLLALSPRHPAAQHLSPTSPFRNPGHSARAVLDACAQADLVITSTPAILERYAPHGRGVLLRNRLRSDWASCLEVGPPGLRGGHPHTAPRVSAPHKDVSPLRVGWPGALGNHPDDLAILSRVLPRLPITEFTIVGPPPSSREVTPPALGAALRFTGSVPFADWLPMIRHSLDIGVATLEPSRFNRAKSWLKPLELAAAGVPFVASPTDEYKHLGAGLIPTGEERKGLTHLLRQLLTSPALRAEERERNFAIAAANTYEKHLDEWLEALAPFTEPAPLTSALVTDGVSSTA